MWCARLALVSASIVAFGCDEPEPLPKLAELPAFELTDHRGDAFNVGELSGKVWVADFIFTHCPTFCPLLTERLAGVRRRLASEHDGDVSYVSISVDPERDTPEVLARYAEEHGTLHKDWVYLTGDTDKVTDIVVEGFKAPMGEPVAAAGDKYSILHARHFILVDRERRVRGYYRTEPDSLDRLVHDVGVLLREGR